MKEVDEYIASYPEDRQKRLQEIRDIIRSAAPQAQEKISWRMPTFVFHGNLVHFAMHKNHIGFYPGPSGVEAFESKLHGFKFSKGAIQFPLDQPLPKELIHEIVTFRVNENIK